MIKRKTLFFVVILSFFQLFFAGKTDNHNPELKVVVNNEVPVSEMSITEVEACLKGEKLRWKNKLKVKIAIMKTSNIIGRLTAEKFLGMMPNEMDKFYLLNVFQGNIEAPKTFTSEQQLIDYVTETPGCLGIVGDIENTQSVKVIKLK